jgi:copper chaperone
MKTTIYIQNLKCGGCAKTITNKLSEINEIEDINVLIDESAVTFNYKNESIINVVKETLKNTGYPEISDENSLLTKAKSYVSCAVGKM